MHFSNRGVCEFISFFLKEGLEFQVIEVERLMAQELRNHELEAHR